MTFLESAVKRISYYKDLGDKTLAQLTTEQLHWQPAGDPNSIYLIIKHLSGNMLSRWTDFLTTDGEKPSRNRDIEFEEDTAAATEVMDTWEKGWKCMLDTLQSLRAAD